MKKEHKIKKKQKICKISEIYAPFKIYAKRKLSGVTYFTELKKKYTHRTCYKEKSTKGNITLQQLTSTYINTNHNTIDDDVRFDKGNSLFFIYVTLRAHI